MNNPSTNLFAQNINNLAQNINNLAQIDIFEKYRAEVMGDAINNNLPYINIYDKFNSSSDETSSQQYDSDDDVVLNSISNKKQSNSRRKKSKKQSKKSKQVNFILEDGLESFDPSRVETIDFGEQNEICPYCSAKLWKAEIEGINTRKRKYKYCCEDGKVQLQKIPDPPQELKDLYLDTTSILGIYFHQNLRRLNCALALAWFDAREVRLPGLSQFKINGMVHNKIGSICPMDGKQHSFAQIYILDNEDQLQRRLQLNNLTGDNGEYTSQAKQILTKLQKILMKHNTLVHTIRNAFEQSQSQPIPDLSIVLQEDVPNAATRTYNAPTVSEIAAIIPTCKSKDLRGITIPYKTGKLHTINETNPVYDALQYVLFYPYATLTWPKDVCSGV